MDKDCSSIKIVSSCFLKPKTNPKESKQPYYMSPIELVLPLSHYIQHGHFFLKPSNFVMETFLDDLKDSVAAALVHFYPLAGRLCTKSNSVFVDCNNSPGAGFIYAKLDLRVMDIVDSKYIPPIVYFLFDHHKTSNLQGHTLSLLSVKVTELVDGVFIGLSMNHMLADGTSFWNFYNSWSQIFQATHLKNNNNTNNNFCLANPPVLNRWFPEGYGPDSNIPLSYFNESNKVLESPILKERIFHFSPETISSLKSKINQECGTITISSFQSLSAMIWRCITRARGLPYGQQTTCRISANIRGRIKPPLAENYFGNCVSLLVTTTKVGELLENKLGWAALKIHQTVNEHTSEKIDEICKEMSKPGMKLLMPSDNHMVISIGSSPRFNMYGIEFGMGKAVAARSGYSNKFDGKIRGDPGREGRGSVDLAVCLNPKCMEALETDQEFMSLVSS